MAWVNACYVLLDRAIVAGRADEPALLDDGVSHARLLEDVAAVGGVLRAQGVTPGVGVRVDATDGRRAVTALLAAARLGAVLGDEGLLVDDADVGELAWDEALRLGRTDPAAVVELEPNAPWTDGRTAGDLAADLADVVLPVAAADLVSALRSSLGG